MLLLNVVFRQGDVESWWVYRYLKSRTDRGGRGAELKQHKSKGKDET
jgi:hypothetical protein